jgi:hypothetical protein
MNPDQAVTDQAVVDQSVTEQAVPDLIIEDETVSEQSVPDQGVQPDQVYEKTFVFCILSDDNTVSCNFMKLWTEIVGYCIMKKIKPILSTVSNDNFSARMNALTPSSETCKPFEGKIDYDRIVYISSKSICSIGLLEKIISSDKDIVSALSTNKMSLENTNYIEDFNMEDETKQSFVYAKVEDAKTKLKTAKDAGESTLLKVNFVNFSLLSINKGVFEKMGLPWFNYDPRTNDITGDIHFANKCKESGVDIYVELDCFIPTEKNIIY